MSKKKKKLAVVPTPPAAEQAETPAQVAHVDCPICGKHEWVSVDEYRHKAEGMKLCTHCGFCTYPDIVANQDKLKEHYRSEYRQNQAPSSAHVFTGQRKLHYHAHFLNDLFVEWKKRNLTAPAVFEIGAAFGMFLNMVKGTFKNAKVAGSELTRSFRRVAYHEHGIEPGEDFDDSRKYDLIATYKVLEHQPNPDKELRRYALALKDDGHLYISVPTWFHTMSNFGTSGFTLDYYYDKNHINVWTRKLFETLLKKSGLEVVKANYVFYDSTYLCKRNDALMELPLELEAPTEIVAKLGKIKKAFELADNQDFDAALREFPCYPDAIVASYEHKRKQYHALGWDGIVREAITPALALMPDNQRILAWAADLHIRYEKYQEALELLNRLLLAKPGDPEGMNAIGTCLRELAHRQQDPKEKIRLLFEARNIYRELQKQSLQHVHECITWIFAIDAQIPMPSELGIEPEKPAQG